jgi:uncharacterized DUF497 family protein
MDVRLHLAGNDFVWDSEKAQSNRFAHGVRFEDAATVFLDPLFKLTDASRRGQARHAAIGFDHLARLLFVVHIELDGDCIRLISARPATAAEEAHYAD